MKNPDNETLAIMAIYLMGFLLVAWFDLRLGIGLMCWQVSKEMCNSRKEP